ncbi:MAG: hypothetical protein J6X55_01535, partial [Victivallales bacterium]|nr:hypothetical protein [Victivallales bacterium]
QQDKQEQQTPKQEQKVAQQDKQEKVVQQDKQEQIAQQDKQEQQMPKQEQKVAQQGKQEQIAQQDKQEQQTPKQEQKVAQQDKKEPLKKEDVQQQTIAQNNPTDKNILPPGKIFLFGEDNTGTQQILSVVKSSLPGKTVTLEKAGISSKAIGQISGLQAQKPDLILVAVTSRYSSMSLTNFESKVNELLDQLISRGTNFIFVLEPTAGRNSRFCNGNDVVREACTRRGRDWLDCQTEINIDPEILLQK